MRANYQITIFLLLVTVFVSALSVYAQQPKRNLIANSQFEEGLKNWRQKTENNASASFLEEMTAPISGKKSAKLKLETLGTTDDVRNARLAYFLPVEKDAKYKVVLKVRSDKPAVLGIEFAENYGEKTPIALPRPLPSGFLGDGRYLKGTIDVSTEMREYVFTTNATAKSDWNYVFAFNFGGSKQVGVTFFIDDIKISRADDGDWTGNLFPWGDFEDVVPTNVTSGPVEDFCVKINSPLQTFDERAIGEYTKSTNLITYDVPSEFPQESAPLFNISVDGKFTGVYNDVNAWGKFVSFGYFDFNPNHEVEVEITCANTFSSYEILPQKNGIQSIRDGNKIRFKTKKTDQAITVIFDNAYQGNVLHLFANSIDLEAPTASSDNLIYYGRGFHDLNGTVSIGSNKHIYIAGGAVVKGTLKMESGSNMSIKGRGMLLKTDPNGVVLSSSYTKNTLIDGILVHNHRNPGWTVAFHVASEMTVTNTKVVSTRYASTDGFDIVNSNNISLKNTFIRACDDAIAIKGLIEGKPADCPPNENMIFESLQIWNDCNNAMCLGAETRAAYYKNIKFKDIDVLYSYDDKGNHEQLDERSAMSIVCLEGTFFSDISYEDIRVNRCERLICLTFKDSFWFGSIQGDQTTEGGINGVTYKNITSANNSGSSIANNILLNGWYQTGTPTKYVENITFNNVVVEGNLVNSDTDKNIITNNSSRRTLVRNLYFNTEVRQAELSESSTLAKNVFATSTSTSFGNWSIDNNNVFSSQKSLSMAKSELIEGATSRDFMLNIPYWVNEKSEIEVSFDIKGGSTQGKIGLKSVNYVNEESAMPSVLVASPEITTAIQNLKYSHSNSDATPDLENSGFYTSSYDGKQHLEVSLSQSDLTPANFNCWIDNIEIREKVELKDITLLGLPTTNSIKVGESLTLSIDEFVTPTNAPTKVYFMVENIDGEAQMSADGVLKGIKEGRFILKVSNSNQIVIKEYALSVGNGASIENEKNNTLYVYPSRLKSGDSFNISQTAEQIHVYDIGGIEILEAAQADQVSTLGWKSGIYLVKLRALEKEVVSKVSVY